MVRSWRREGIVIVYILEASGWSWSRDGFAFFVGWIKGMGMAVGGVGAMRGLGRPTSLVRRVVRLRFWEKGSKILSRCEHHDDCRLYMYSRGVTRA
jgi:hypothetical protein